MFKTNLVKGGELKSKSEENISKRLSLYMYMPSPVLPPPSLPLPTSSSSTMSRWTREAEWGRGEAGGI